MSSVREVSSWRGLLAAIADLRRYGSPVTQMADYVPFYLRVGRRVVVTAPIQCESQLTLGGEDSGLEIEFRTYCAPFGLDLSVVDDAIVSIRGLNTIGMGADRVAITVSDGASVELRDCFAAVDATVSGGSLSAHSSYLGGTVTLLDGALYLMSCLGQGLDVAQSGGQLYATGGVLDDIAISGGEAYVTGTVVDTVTTTGGSGSFAYADVGTFNDSGGGTHTEPVTIDNYRPNIPLSLVSTSDTVSLADLTCYGLYVGRAIKDNPTVKIGLRVTTVGTVVANEVAVATGNFTLGVTTHYLTYRGHSSFTWALGARYATVNTAGISAGDDIWVLLWVDSTSTPSVSATSSRDRLRTGAFVSRANTQPSTMAASTIFNAISDSADHPVLLAQQS